MYDGNVETAIQKGNRIGKLFLSITDVLNGQLPAASCQQCTMEAMESLWLHAEKL